MALAGADLSARFKALGSVRPSCRLSGKDQFDADRSAKWQWQSSARDNSGRMSCRQNKFRQLPASGVESLLLETSRAVFGRRRQSEFARPQLVPIPSAA